MDQRQAVAALAALAVLGLLAVLRSMRRQAQLAARAMYEGTEHVSVVGRGLLLGGLILAGQWLVITYAADNPTLYWAALGVPAGVAGLALVRVFTVTVTPRPRRGGGRR